jgi:hypothetical protein
MLSRVLNQVRPVHVLPSSYFPRKDYDINSRSSKQYLALKLPIKTADFPLLSQEMEKKMGKLRKIMTRKGYQTN